MSASEDKTVLLWVPHGQSGAGDIAARGEMEAKGNAANAGAGDGNALPPHLDAWRGVLLPSGLRGWLSENAQ